MKSPKALTNFIKQARAQLMRLTPMHMTAGFTMIELVVVVALVAMIAGVGITMSFSSLAKANVVQERDLLVSLLLSGARARALANIDETSHGVHVNGASTPHKTYTLFEGASYTTNPSSYKVVNFGSDSTVVKNSANQQTFDIIFEQRSGDIPAGDNTITLTSNGKDAIFFINKAGRIDW